VSVGTMESVGPRLTFAAYTIMVPAMSAAATTPQRTVLRPSLKFKPSLLIDASSVPLRGQLFADLTDGPITHREFNLQDHLRLASRRSACSRTRGSESLTPISAAPLNASLLTKVGRTVSAPRRTPGSA